MRACAPLRVAVGRLGTVGQTRFGLGGGRSRCSLLPSRSLRVVRVARVFVSGHPRPGRAQCGRPASPLRAAGRRIRVVSEWREQRRGARPARRRGRSALPARTGITNRTQGLERSHLGADVGTHAVRPSRCGGKRRRVWVKEGQARIGPVQRWGVYTVQCVCRGRRGCNGRRDVGTAA